MRDCIRCFLVTVIAALVCCDIRICQLVCVNPSARKHSTQSGKLIAEACLLLALGCLIKIYMQTATARTFIVSVYCVCLALHQARRSNSDRHTVIPLSPYTCAHEHVNCIQLPAYCNMPSRVALPKHHLLSSTNFFCCVSELLVECT